VGWRQAVAVLVMLASCEPVDEGAAPPDAPDDLVAASRRVEIEVLGDFSVAPTLPDSVLTTVRSPVLRVGDGSAAFFALERPRVPARCISDVRLRLFVEEWSALAQEELAIYPSHVFNALEKRDGDRYGYSGALLDVRPRGTLDSFTAGWAEWDVTGIVKRWVGSWTFPSLGRRVPGRGPVVLALRDVDLAEPFARAKIASTESPGRPRAFAFVEEGCPARGRA
jgi:hypothetical protein